MKLPLSWLNEYIKTDKTPEELEQLLISVGFEVEEIIYTGENIKNVVTGKVLSCKKHESADKLRVLEIDTGKDKLTIVTGASNVKTGDIVPVALDGAKLPNGMEIKSSALRGVMSYGMLCSGQELMIDDNVIEGAEIDGILILPDNTPIGKDIKDILALNDYVLDISITANRPDCQSIYGIAREIAAILNTKLKTPNLNFKEHPCDLKEIKVIIDDYNLCSKYMGRFIKNVKIQKSPKWMRDRLRMCGIRAINNMVDITNYVLLEIGQPLHAFDIRYINGDINVRTAKENEQVTALDSNTYTLKQDNLVIADDNKILAIAGVMGGEYTSIFDDTKDVFLEAARFNRGSIRRTSRAISLRSDSSARFEKGVDFLNVEMGSNRALALVEQLECGTILQGIMQDSIETPQRKIISTTAGQISALLGISVNDDEIIKILKALEINVTKKQQTLICEIPLFREDIDNYADLAEEVMRFHGYDKIVSTWHKSSGNIIGSLSLRDKNINNIKDILCAFGAYETINYSFINKNSYDKLLLPSNHNLRKTIPLLNPLSEELAVMRTQLASSILNVIKLNHNRKNDNFKIFELSKVFLPKELPLKDLPHERHALCIALSGNNEDFYALKNIVTHLLKYFKLEYSLQCGTVEYLHDKQSADIIINDNIIGSFGKIHPLCAEKFEIKSDVYLANFDIEYLLSAQPSLNRYKALSKFPFVERDLAVVIDENISVAELINEIKANSSLLENVRLFDVYSGKQIEAGKKSAAFSLVLQSYEKTLSEKEIQSEMDNIIKSLENKFSAKLR